MFRQYAWPGNIRQLSNTIERAILMEDQMVIRKSSVSLPEIEDLTPHKAQPTGLKLSENQEKELIANALEDNLWIQKDAARQLDISPRALNYRIKKLGITHARWRKNK
jgi:transcriptional regulator with PAS, ATPase and Fis domain